jgi:hypothetical protein
MPRIKITVRYQSFGDNDQQYFSDIKRKSREQIARDYPGATDLVQNIYTDGIPDATNLGDLRSNNQVAVGTEFTVSEEQSAAIKAKMR